MKIIYHENYNINVGIFKFLHPFDGCKFSKVRAVLNDADVIAPQGPIAEDATIRFAKAGSLLANIAVRSK